MKKLSNLLLIFIAVLFNGCIKEKPVNTQNPSASSWSLREAYLGFAGIEFLENNLIIWEFNGANQLTVLLADTVFNQNIPFSSINEAVYEYTATDSTIVINGQWFNLNLDSNLLSIDQNPALDGILLNFVKND
mgnify:FL=1|tara:strand:+ start:192 stop:590 length:399 start_codon:yes stop_codon:yes gene_type:complete